METVIHHLSDAAPKLDTDQLPEWCNVYAGLSDEEIATLERAVSRRLDLYRDLGISS